MIFHFFQSLLAKIHMVTKLEFVEKCKQKCLILAKIHMVTKQKSDKMVFLSSLILAKIHMVTKQQWKLQY